MTIYALSVGLAHGWLDPRTFLEPVSKGWSALAKGSVTASGNITVGAFASCPDPHTRLTPDPDADPHTYLTPNPDPHT